MRIKLDENVPARAAERLRTLGHDVDTVITEGLAGRPDPDVWQAARARRRAVAAHRLPYRLAWNTRMRELESLLRGGNAE